jgi:hypothetical protein
MDKILSDKEIEDLVLEPKRIPDGLSPLRRLTQHGMHVRKDFEVESKISPDNGFVVKVRQSSINSLDFSAILGYKVPGTNTIFRLRRYNGSNHDHTNPLERTTLTGFHIHKATERYQRHGPHHDTFAESTSDHSSLDTAIRALLRDCGFDPPEIPGDLFGDII